jgi:hypothetical protein
VSDPARLAEEQWPTMLRLMEERGPDAVVDYIAAFEDPATRRQLHSRAQQGFGGGTWAGRNLDAITTVVEAGIAEAIAQAFSEADDAERAKRIDFANVLSYNLSAALADCWPEDDLPREARHLESGLRAADHCLAWRRELSKGPGPFSIAWWARGIHLLSLGRVELAEQAMAESLAFARQAVTVRGGSTAIDATGDWMTLLGEGYLALARRADGGGDGDAGAAWTAALAALDAGARARPDDAEDLAFSRDQLLAAERKLRARGILPT